MALNKLKEKAWRREEQRERLMQMDKVGENHKKLKWNFKKVFRSKRANSAPEKCRRKGSEKEERNKEEMDV